MLDGAAKTAPFSYEAGEGKRAFVIIQNIHCAGRDWQSKKVVETRKPVVYLGNMLQTLEQRVEYLEREFSEFRSQVLGLKLRKKDWRRTVGMLADDADEMSREAAMFGRTYREEQTSQKEIAGS